MTKSFHGNPCWYELTTSKGNLRSAQDFYAGIFGWTFEDSGMRDFHYHLARSDSDRVAGFMEAPDNDAEVLPFWMTYFAVDEAGAFVADATALGATLCRAPEDVPGIGCFAVLSDPNGAAFGILQPDMSNLSDAGIATAERGDGAFHPTKPGRCNWNELMSADPDAGFAFYARLFGWTKGRAIDMGGMGAYQLFQRDGTDIGGMMGLGKAARANWQPYFGVRGHVGDATDAIKASGGRVHQGPIEVPGGMYVAVAQDPQDAWFAVTGAEK
jgi:predicted enzyme related to lactoylglutathione lyase